MSENDPVIIDLIDLNPLPQGLFSKLKDIIRTQPTVEFSKKFTLVELIPECGYNAVICREMNCLITCSYDSVIVYDLVSKEKSVIIPNAGVGALGVDLEKEISGQCNLIISMENNTVAKYDFKAMMERKNYNGSLIWESSVKFQHVWAIRSFKTELYVIDFANSVHVLDLKTGKENKEITVKLGHGIVDLVFTPDEEMIVCGVNHLHILKFNTSSKQWETTKSYQARNDSEKIYRCFGLWYEKKTRLIYLSDPEGRILIVDMDLNFVKAVNECKVPCGILINEKNGEMFVCDSETKQIYIYK